MGVDNRVKLTGLGSTIKVRPTLAQYVLYRIPHATSSTPLCAMLSEVDSAVYRKSYPVEVDRDITIGE
jgi:hypothetical protein